MQWIPTSHKKEFLEEYESDVIQLMIGDITHDVKLIRTKRDTKWGTVGPNLRTKVVSRQTQHVCLNCLIACQSHIWCMCTTPQVETSRLIVRIVYIQSGKQYKPSTPILLSLN